MFSSFQQQCNYVETKTESYKSIEEFNVFMSHNQPTCDLSIECRNVGIMLQEVLISKEDKLENHWQIKIRSSMYAMTTLPVKSCNKALKYASHSIHFLENTCRRILNGANFRIQ